MPARGALRRDTGLVLGRERGHARVGEGDLDGDRLSQLAGGFVKRLRSDESQAQQSHRGPARPERDQEPRPGPQPGDEVGQFGVIGGDGAGAR
jgi:hypothetical protein